MIKDGVPLITFEELYKVMETTTQPSVFSEIRLLVDLAIKHERKDFLGWLSTHDTGNGGLLFTREEFLNVK